MDHIDKTSIFVEVVRQQSFHKAALKLGMTASSVSKHVMTLEDALRTKLLNRTTRSLSLTEEGALYFERASKAIDDLRDATGLIQDMKASPVGLLKINAPQTFGSRYLAKAIAEFSCQHESLSVEVDFEDRMVDVIEEGYDVVIRIGTLADSTLIGRKLAPCPIYLCASPDYLKRQGTPTHPNDLKNHDVIAYTRHGGVHEWRYRAKDGLTDTISLHGRIRANNAEMMAEAAIQGLGMVALPIFAIQEALDDGKLVRVLPDYETDPQRNIYAIFPKSRYLSNKIRLFVDFISQHCATFPWQENL